MIKILNTISILETILVNKEKIVDYYYDFKFLKIIHSLLIIIQIYL